MEETLRVHKFDELPSQADFESQIESRNVPAIFNGCIKGWEAMSKWNPRNGGLNYLQEGVGNAVVEAMLSRSAPVFYGDLRGPEMVPLPFSTFITSCKQRLTNSKDDCGACVESENHGVMGHTADESCLASPHQVYLAQNIEKIGKQGNGQDECGLDKKCGTKDLVGTNQKQKIMMHQLDPHAVQALHKLVSLVHDNVDSGAQSKPLQYTLTDGSADHVRGDCRKITRLNSFCLEDDPVAKILCTLEPNELQNVLLAMVHNFPRTMEALILHMLSPVGAEILTRKFDEMDQLITKEERNEFYQVFYGVFDDQFAAMEAILNGKESFVFQVFQNVLDKYLGVKFDE